MPWKSLLTLLFLLLMTLCVGVVLVFHPPTITIGFIGSLTGKYSAMGSTCRNGAILALEQANTSKKWWQVWHPRFALDIRNDGGSPTMAKKAAQALIERKVAALIGPSFTSTALAIFPLINRENLVTVGASISGQALHGANDFFFALHPSTAQMGEAAAKLAIKRKFKKVLIISDRNNAEFVDSFSSSFRRHFEAKASAQERISALEFSTLENEITSLVSVAVAQKPDVILLLASSLDTGILAQHLRKNVSSSLMTSSWAIDNQLIEIGGRAVDGMEFVMGFPFSEINSATSEFGRLYLQRFATEPTYCARAHFEAFALLAQILEKVPSANGDFLRKLILDKRIFSISDTTLILDSQGDALRPLIPSAIQQGSFVQLREAL